MRLLATLLTLYLLSTVTHALDCRGHRCPSGQICQVSGSQLRCVDDIEAIPETLVTCGDVTCENGWCNVVDGYPKCMDSSVSGNVCKDFKGCASGTYCANVNGRPTCLVHGGSSTSSNNHICNNVTCPAGMKCANLNGVAVCNFQSSGSATGTTRPPGWINPCEYVKCPDGLSCQAIGDGEEVMCLDTSGSVSGNPSELGCDVIKCPDGMKCSIVNGTPVCSGTSGQATLPPSGPCAGIDCPAGLFCNAVNGRPVCLATKPEGSCKDVVCSPGMYCAMINKQPQCLVGTSGQATLPPSGPCAGIDCPAGLFCNAVNGKPVCLTTKPEGSCKDVVCSPGMYCAMVNKQPQCLLSTSGPSTGGDPICAGVSCPSGLYCNAVDGKPLCLSTKPPMGSCKDITCASGMYCAMVNQKPTCLFGSTGSHTTGHTLPPTQPDLCETISCPTGMNCGVQNGEAMCFYNAGGSACGNTFCTPPLFCSHATGQPMCVHDEPPNLDCEAKCVGVRCSDPSQVCAVYQGQAVCVYPPTGGITEHNANCTNVHCPVPSVCVVSDSKTFCMYPNGHSNVLVRTRLTQQVPMVANSLPNNCQNLGCDKYGAVCTVVDSVPFCVLKSDFDPNAQLCPMVKCKAGTRCESRNGATYCVPDSPCRSNSCPFGQECKVSFDGQPYCQRPNTFATCKTLVCSNNLVCHELTLGVTPASCFQRCSGQCSKGNQCLIIHGQSSCVTIRS
eukprot:gene13079-15385_t